MERVWRESKEGMVIDGRKRRGEEARRLGGSRRVYYTPYTKY